MEPQSRLLHAWPLAGGVFAQMTAFEIERTDGLIVKMVVRCHGEVDRTRNPDISAHEFCLLKILRSAGIAVPAPIYLEQFESTLLAPCIVVEYIEGSTDFAPADLDDTLRQMARQLVQIHRVDSANADLAFLPRQTHGVGKRPTMLDDSLSQGRIRDALELARPLKHADSANAPVLLHGDFWPGNILWRDGQLVAVIDWEDAMVGDPLADVANSRLEILWAFGRDAMHSFTDLMHSMTAIDFASLAYWDLCAALRPAGKLGSWGLDAEPSRPCVLSHAWFVDEALGAAAPVAVTEVCIGSRTLRPQDLPRRPPQAAVDPMRQRRLPSIRLAQATCSESIPRSGCCSSSLTDRANTTELSWIVSASVISSTNCCLMIA